jgi:hypothetical protein
MDNIYKEIQEAVVEKFGVNCSAELKINIHPLTSTSEPSIHVKQYAIQPEGSAKISKEIYISSSGGLYTLPESIRNVIEL